ncbi:hypothetical protein NEUTE1DRAFT_116574 [Neurospora tetrasperma FGSC 2508]|uniref:Uncharacterized protein n=1 Tax=Neurospora tetrasperma (strain FGSC 2508 / ATCC MYA-4615 / P0657) TaxID=510951 RepID=F8MHD3_NEUT8|nr:uncharacterized protein NEUTE1DRAFT_116574 [Neurospora tetrasperma FGSC 2508]EGO59596.1 hypothetical protein NEUTE1DRAFT_116574 [Neurospora tetrasperma FGSC 2508]EGZ73724.1 hypothetical protein NEUTE2DRAFT_144266 [Neurospora tetrasperma FGSC 2509]
MSAPTTSDAAKSEQKLPSREEQLATMTARVEEFQKQNPSADFKLEQKWWVPSLDFGILLQDALPQEINAEFGAIFAKLFQDKFAPEAVAKARKQSRELLQAKYPHVLERVEEMVFKNEAQLAELHHHLQGVDSIGCAGGNC